MTRGFAVRTGPWWLFRTALHRFRCANCRAQYHATYGGQQMSPDYRADPYDPMKMCPACQGIGSVDNGRTCRTCDGIGQIPGKKPQ